MTEYQEEQKPTGRFQTPRKLGDIKESEASTQSQLAEQHFLTLQSVKVSPHLHN